MSNPHSTHGKLKDSDAMWANNALINNSVRKVGGSTNVRTVGETAGFSGVPSANNISADKQFYNLPNRLTQQKT